MLRVVPGAGLYFGIVHNLQLAFDTKEAPRLSAANLVIGSGSHAVVALVFLPVTILKARAESGLFKDEGVWQGLRSLRRAEGIRGAAMY